MSINSFFRSLPISCGRCPRPANTECGKPEACWGIIRSFPITARCARRSTEPIEGIITINPTKEFDFADKVRQEPSRREYLTIEELKLLIATPCRHEIIKQAFLFSCLCGLRVSDIRKLTWSDLQQSGGRVRIEIKMQKTKEPLYLPISDEALKWLPERGEAKDGDIIFPLTHEGTVNDTLQHWAKVAGITKHISFHVAKHHTISI